MIVRVVDGKGIIRGCPKGRLLTCFQPCGLPRYGLVRLGSWLMRCVDIYRLSLANTLQVTECPVIHIKGAEYLFSCYIVSSFFLALYSKPADIQSFDNTQLDLKLEPKLEDLALFLGNVE
mmetsp:Transcript_16055/g.34793  ORF Transcript_16055/g.34793 Transcript_16055/m.34793 type:complete len:120 (-) Transcript_16055:4749-5108(-)